MHAMLEKLRAGQVVAGLGVRQSGTPDIVHVAAAAGYDFIFIDCEHSALGTESAASLACAALGSAVTAAVRVPGHEPWLAGRMLDCGALAIFFPQVESADDARSLAAACRYPPRGTRSVGASILQARRPGVPLRELAEASDAQTLVVAMIESPAGIQSAVDIAGVDGIDALVMGALELSFALGVPGELDHPLVVTAFARLVDAAARHGKFIGIGGLRTPALFERYLDLGARILLTGSDYSLLIEAAGERLRAVRAAAARRVPPPQADNATRFTPAHPTR